MIRDPVPDDRDVDVVQIFADALRRRHREAGRISYTTIEHTAQTSKAAISRRAPRGDRLPGWASQLARTVARALLDFANACELAAGEPEVAITADDDVELPVGRSERQRQILKLDGLATEGGMKTADIAGEIGYEVPNTHPTMHALERNGLVELLSGVIPQTWQLAPKYRNNAPVFKRVASRVKEGEWTTYGDVSIAVRGDVKAARGVGRAAATMPDFSHPERILMDVGVINPNWRDADGRGPERCRELLSGQGVAFDENGHADKAHRVRWDAAVTSLSLSPSRGATTGACSAHIRGYLRPGSGQEGAGPDPLPGIL